MQYPCPDTALLGKRAKTTEDAWHSAPMQGGVHDAVVRRRFEIAADGPSIAVGILVPNRRLRHFAAVSGGAYPSCDRTAGDDAFRISGIDGRLRGTGNLRLTVRDVAGSGSWQPSTA
jgi:hypothetical protein